MSCSSCQLVHDALAQRREAKAGTRQVDTPDRRRRVDHACRLSTRGTATHRKNIVITAARIGTSMRSMVGAHARGSLDGTPEKF